MTRKRDFTTVTDETGQVVAFYTEDIVCLKRTAEGEMVVYLAHGVPPIVSTKAVGFDAWEHLLRAFRSLGE